LRHFGFLSEDEDHRLFRRPPQHFDRSSATDVLSIALGATLYMPATRSKLSCDIVKQAERGLTSMVLCLEDSIADDDVGLGEDNIVCVAEQLRQCSVDELPMIFVRVRRPDQITLLVARLGPAASVLTGFVLPKFNVATGEAFLNQLAHADEIAGSQLLAMPVLETGGVLYAETRTEELLGLTKLLDVHRQRILALRIGATDLCALYGLRRSHDLTIWDIRVVAEAITAVVNTLGRCDRSGFTITGPVWEYFTSTERLFKPRLRESPFSEHNVIELRDRLLSRDIDGLLREVELDKANGLSGKTVIHPTHVAVVHALSVVALEEYRDATDILSAERQGALASGYGNKMNEIGPHRAWARHIIRRADVFGVAASDISFVDLLIASLNR
jgi:citrate lyase beta subunit